MKRGGALATALMVAMAMGVPLADAYEPRERREEAPKKCRREGCENPRTGEKLYCSAECCKADRRKP